MNIVILGGGGVVGQKLAQNLCARGHFKGKSITRITLADIVMPPATAGCDTMVCDITNPASVAAAIPAGTDVIYLLAAIVSAHAEAEFEAGMQINLQGTMAVLERARALGTKPTLVFSSSIAVFGGEAPNPITDHVVLNPQTSYGTQKAIGEMLVQDYARKGFIDGRAFRLPTISMRPGKPNRAASSFMSSILREPLNGQEAICPVGPEFPHFYLSPRMCAENLVRGAEVAEEKLGQNRAMIMPGRIWTIQQLIDAMTAVAGPGPAKLIRWESQPEIERIVMGWRWDIRAGKSLELGLEADESFQDNIRYYLEDDLPRA